MRLGISLRILSTLLILLGSDARAQQAPSIEGTWVVSIGEADGTELDVRMTFARSSQGFEAWSKANAVQDQLPWYTAFAARLFRKLPAHGAFMHLKGRITSDTIEAELTSQFMRAYDVHATLRGDRMIGTLVPRNAPNAAPGSFRASRSSSTGPLRDYVSIAKRVRDTAAATIYDPALAGGRAWNDFFRDFSRDMARADDDLDAVVAFNARAARLPFSHAGFIRNPRIAATSYAELVRGDTAIFPDTLVTLTFPAPDVAQLRVTKWERVSEAVHRAFARIDSVHATTLILDIRSNPGGDATSAVPLSHLVSDSTNMGFFLGPKWYEAHNGPPADSMRNRVPWLTSDSSGTTLLDRVRSNGIVAVTVIPVRPLFAGKVFLLVDRNTGSASEPLAHALKESGRATVIGTRTAGHMLTALPHAVGDGFIVRLPEADYYATGGVRLEGNGVSPHVEAQRGREFLVVADSLAARSPLAAAVIRGNAFYNLRDFAAADRYFAEAERLSPKNANLRSARVVVAMAEQKWDQAERLLEQAAQGDTTPATPFVRARFAVASRRNMDRSIAEMRSILSREPPYATNTRATAHKRLGLLLNAAGDTAAAIQELERSVALEPRDAEALSTLAALRRKVRDPGPR